MSSKLKDAARKFAGVGTAKAAPATIEVCFLKGGRELVKLAREFAAEENMDPDIPQYILIHDLEYLVEGDVLPNYPDEEG